MSRRRNEQIVLWCAGVLLIVLGAVSNEWTIGHVLSPQAPLESAAKRGVSWAMSLSALGLVVWMIRSRRSIRMVKAAAFGCSCGLFFFLVFSGELCLSYFFLTHKNGTRAMGEYVIQDEALGWRPKPGGKAKIFRPGGAMVEYGIDG